MVANTAASASTGSHCARVNRRSGGRATASSTTAATSCRTATTPTGPMAPNAWAATAAPVWLLAAPVSRAAIPGPGRRCPAASDGVVGTGGRGSDVRTGVALETGVVVTPPLSDPCPDTQMHRAADRYTLSA